MSFRRSPEYSDELEPIDRQVSTEFLVETVEAALQTQKSRFDQRGQRPEHLVAFFTPERSVLRRGKNAVGSIRLGGESSPDVLYQLTIQGRSWTQFVITRDRQVLETGGYQYRPETSSELSPSEIWSLAEDVGGPETARIHNLAHPGRIRQVIKQGHAYSETEARMVLTRLEFEREWEWRAGFRNRHRPFFHRWFGIDTTQPLHVAELEAGKIHEQVELAVQKSGGSTTYQKAADEIVEGVLKSYERVIAEEELGRFVRPVLASGDYDTVASRIRWFSENTTPEKKKAVIEVAADFLVDHIDELVRRGNVEAALTRLAKELYGNPAFRELLVRPKPDYSPELADQYWAAAVIDLVDACDFPDKFARHRDFWDWIKALSKEDANQHPRILDEVEQRLVQRADDPSRYKSVRESWIEAGLLQRDTPPAEQVVEQAFKKLLQAADDELPRLVSVRDIYLEAGVFDEEINHHSVLVGRVASTIARTSSGPYEYEKERDSFVEAGFGSIELFSRNPEVKELAKAHLAQHCHSLESFTHYREGWIEVGVLTIEEANSLPEARQAALSDPPRWYAAGVTTPGQQLSH